MMIRTEIIAALRDMLNDIAEEAAVCHVVGNHQAESAYRADYARIELLLIQADARWPVTIDGLHQAAAISSPRPAP